MKAFKEHALLIFLAIGLIVLGITLNFLQKGISLEYKQIRTLDISNNVVTINQISYPTSYFALELVSRLLYGVATAILIALLVTSRLNAKKEKELQEQREQIKLDVFESLFGNIIPEELFRVVKSELIQNQLVVRGAKWHYEFKESLSSPSRIDLRLTVKYPIENIGQKTVSDPIRLRCLNAPGSMNILESARCVKNGKTEFEYNYHRPEDNTNVKVEPNFNNDPEYQQVTLPVVIAGRSSADLTMIFKIEYAEAVVDSYYGKHPIIGGDFIFQFPEGYELRLSPSFSALLKPSIIEQDKQTYELEGSILPRQGFTYTLRKKA